jgi:hypothetical protein
VRLANVPQNEANAAAARVLALRAIDSPVHAGARSRDILRAAMAFRPAGRPR